MILLDDMISESTKCGTITVSVYKNESNKRFFQIISDNDDVLPVSYIIEDTLSLY